MVNLKFLRKVTCLIDVLFSSSSLWGDGEEV